MYLNARTASDTTKKPLDMTVVRRFAGAALTSTHRAVSLEYSQWCKSHGPASQLLSMV